MSLAATSDAERSGSRKANLFIVGAPKCGTTAWVEYLRTHPSIFFNRLKENCFFALDLPNFRFVWTEEEYAELFSDAGNEAVVGEASAMYLFSSAAAAAMHQYNPDARILMFLRKQEDYLPSLHNQFLWEFAEEILDFEEVWRLSGQRPASTIPPTCLEPRTLDYKAMGRFQEQVKRYYDLFPRDQVCVVQFDDWVRDPRATYLRILAFLGVQDDGRTDFPPINEGMTYRSRTIVRKLTHPPGALRRLARLVEQVTGIRTDLMKKVVYRAINLLSAKGYKRSISPALRDEIRDFYAADNAQLAQQILDPKRIPKDRVSADG